jgi:hypothetical protein
MKSVIYAKKYYDLINDKMDDQLKNEIIQWLANSENKKTFIQYAKLQDLQNYKIDQDVWFKSANYLNYRDNYYYYNLLFNDYYSWNPSVHKMILIYKSNIHLYYRWQKYDERHYQYLYKIWLYLQYNMIDDIKNLIRWLNFTVTYKY